MLRLRATILLMKTGESTSRNSHRMHSAASKAKVALTAVRGDRTLTLYATAVLKRGGNELGERVGAADWLRLRLRMKLHAVCPQWNYTLRPQPRLQ